MIIVLFVCLAVMVFKGKCFKHWVFLRNFRYPDKMYLNINHWLKQIKQTVSLHLSYLFLTASKSLCPVTTRDTKKIISFSSWLCCITHWFQLFYKILPIFYCKHIWHFAKEICSSYFNSLPRLFSPNSRQWYTWSFF